MASSTDESKPRRSKVVDPNSFRARLGAMMRLMRERRRVSLSKTAEETGGSGINALSRAEKGQTASPRLVELYEETFEDKILLFLASEHPADCVGSTAKMGQLERALAEMSVELDRVKKENGRLHGILTSWKRILVHYNLWHLAARAIVKAPPPPPPSMQRPSRRPPDVEPSAEAEAEVEAGSALDEEDAETSSEGATS